MTPINSETEEFLSRERQDFQGEVKTEEERLRGILEKTLEGEELKEKIRFLAPFTAFLQRAGEHLLDKDL